MRRITITEGEAIEIRGGYLWLGGLREITGYCNSGVQSSSNLKCGTWSLTTSELPWGCTEYFLPVFLFPIVRRCSIPFGFRRICPGQSQRYFSVCSHLFHMDFDSLQLTYIFIFFLIWWNSTKWKGIHISILWVIWRTTLHLNYANSILCPLFLSFISHKGQMTL